MAVSMKKDICGKWKGVKWSSWDYTVQISLAQWS